MRSPTKLEPHRIAWVGFDRRERHARNGSPSGQLNTRMRHWLRALTCVFPLRSTLAEPWSCPAVGTGTPSCRRFSGKLTEPTVRHASSFGDWFPDEFGNVHDEVRALPVRVVGRANLAHTHADNIVETSYRSLSLTCR